MSKKIIKSAVERGDAHTGWQSGDGSSVLNKRVRQVYPTAEIPHKWAHQTQDSARNPQGNLFFEGPTIYSYRTSWPLARIYSRKKPVYVQHGSADNRPMQTEARDTLVLTNSERYSVTTGQHQSAVNHAASHLPQIEVPNVLLYNRDLPYERDGAIAAAKQGHEENLAYFEAEQARLLKEAGRVMREDQVTWRARQAGELHKAMADYMLFFGIRRKMPALLSFAAAFERARRIENPDPASLDKRERASAQRRAAKVAKEARANERKNLILDPCARTDWRLFGAFDVFRGNYLPREFGPVMLRVNGEEIETSMGARVPLAAAPMVWNLVGRCMAIGGRDFAQYKPGFTDTTGSVRNYVRQRVQIGDYPLDRIDADGTLHAGCHVIPYSELAAMARALNL